MNEWTKNWIGMHLLATISGGVSCEMNMNVGAPENIEWRRCNAIDVTRSDEKR